MVVGVFPGMSTSCTVCWILHGLNVVELSRNSFVLKCRNDCLNRTHTVSDEDLVRLGGLYPMQCCERI